MNYFNFVASETIDWTHQRLVYVKADTLREAYNLLEPHYEDWRYTERPSAYVHLPTDELGFNSDDLSPSCYWEASYPSSNPDQYYEDNYPNLN